MGNGSSEESFRCEESVVPERDGLSDQPSHGQLDDVESFSGLVALQVKRGQQACDMGARRHGEQTGFMQAVHELQRRGFLLPGKAYDIEVALPNPNSIVLPIPADKAEFAWMGRLTAMVEFVRMLFSSSSTW